MDHLKVAKETAENITGYTPGDTQVAAIANTFALIAIAEQLQKLNERLDNLTVTDGYEGDGKALNVQTLTRLG